MLSELKPTLLRREHCLAGARAQTSEEGAPAHWCWRVSSEAGSARKWTDCSRIVLLVLEQRVAAGVKSLGSHRQGPKLLHTSSLGVVKSYKIEIQEAQLNFKSSTDNFLIYLIRELGHTYTKN